MLSNVTISRNHLETFQCFLKLSSDSLKSGVIPDSKLKKLAFLQKYIVPNRSLFKAGGNQLCTTYIGSDLEVSPQTVMNWIKSLIKNRILTLRDPSWAKGLRSRSYIVNEENVELVKILNAYNGYDKTYNTSHAKRQKFEMRTKAWKQFNTLLWRPRDIMRIAGTYVGCPEQLAKALQDNIPAYQLAAPSLMNAHAPLAYEFYRCLKLATRNVNLQSIEKHKIPREYSAPKNFDEFRAMFKNFDVMTDIHDVPFTWYSCNKGGDDHKNYVKNTKQVIRDLDAMSSSTNNPNRKKRIKRYSKAYRWLLKYETDILYEGVTKTAPYHSWENLF